MKTDVETVKIDKLDEKIINELVQNSKISLRELAGKLKVSFVTAMNRIKQLEKSGVIEKYTSKINYDAIGLAVNVMIEIRIAKGKLFELEK
ncbi:MAG: winged helix-turn-helix transcriptional regulator, partial [Nanoarchaeota archaeon]|nr:winged helix-turn-helix transcriptional regulator [Nanoarchaeota archaeon]